MGEIIRPIIIKKKKVKPGSLKCERFKYLDMCNLNTYISCVVPLNSFRWNTVRVGYAINLKY